MAKYRVYLQTTASASVEVEADSIEDAEEKAYQKTPGSLCWHCAGHYDLGDLEVAVDQDGEPMIEQID